jgi:hypothetical protein
MKTLTIEVQAFGMVFPRRESFSIMAIRQERPSTRRRPPVADYNITPEDVREWGRPGLDMNLAFHWFADVLNGEYSVAEAREDCLSIINDNRSKSKNTPIDEAAAQA